MEFHEVATNYTDVKHDESQRLRRNRLVFAAPIEFYKCALRTDIYRRRSGEGAAAPPLSVLTETVNGRPALPKEVQGDLADFGSEALFYERGQPYYRIYPDYAAMFAETKLDVPLSILEAPFPSFGLRFARGHEPMIGNHRTGSMLCCITSMAELLRQTSKLRGDPANTITLEDDLAKAIVVKIRDIDTDRSSILNLVLYREDLDLPLSGIMARHEQRTGNPLMTRWVNELKEAFQQMFSVAFLATGMDRTIEPDVLNKDFSKYLEAVNRKDEASISDLHAKANEVRGCKGHAIGRTEALLGKRAFDVDTTTTHDKEGRELSYRATRRAHFHTYWTGEGRTTKKVRFVRMLIVRPDLPVDPRVKGHRTLRSREEETSLLATPAAEEN